MENSKTISDSSSSQTTTTPSRRPSVFERLGPSTGSNAVEVCTSTPASNPLTDTTHACPEKVEKDIFEFWIHQSKTLFLLYEMTLSCFLPFRLIVEIG